MCEPITIASMATTALAGGMQAFGTYKQGQAANEAAKYQAGVARSNAVVAAAGARDAVERGNRDEVQYARQLADYQGRARVAFAANGIMGGAGSALRTMGDIAALGHLDGETLRANKEREQLGYLNRRNQFVHDSEVLLAQGKAAKNAGKYGALTQLAGTAANVGMAGAGAFGPKATVRPVKVNPEAYRLFHPRPMGVY